MSRIGNLPIQIPEGVTVEKTGNIVMVKGPKGGLKFEVNPTILVGVEDSKVTLKRKNEQKQTWALHGLTRAILSNMITGVSSGWSKNLELVGVGYRAQVQGDRLILLVGFSHPVEIKAPDNIEFQVKDNTKITIFGIDKEKVGQIAAKIRQIKPPEPYKGKGIRYEGEVVRRKAGKAGKLQTTGIR